MSQKFITIEENNQGKYFIVIADESGVIEKLHELSYKSLQVAEDIAQKAARDYRVLFVKKDHSK